ncbi:MAG: hypothetical protein JXA14_14240 [Anaerolineae bacterium]|nr:hypothetical protein [Anaerolineae bacterium]
MNTNLTLPSELQEAVQAEVKVHGFDEVATRWLAFLLQADAALPAPTAGGMVARVRELSIGADLATLDIALRKLSMCDPAGLTTSERRVTALLLRDLTSQAHALVATITEDGCASRSSRARS